MTPSEKAWEAAKTIEELQLTDDGVSLNEMSAIIYHLVIKAVEAEREACAWIADHHSETTADGRGEIWIAAKIAKDIRARVKDND